jgi:phosphoenolpyruvate-protein kinase (PTS system EI component)
MDGRPTTIRTLDIGGDKPVSYLSLPNEENPALGIRGVRVSQADTELFDEQLMSILQLKPLSSVQVMVPMIAEIEEVLWVRRRIEIMATQMGLSELPKLGVMIEIPSAAVLADQLAEHVDFFSIGTNDLTQYALAMDRGNPALASRLDQLHPAVLRLIAMTVNGAQKYGRWVGVCGGVASDPCAVPVLVGLGISELSVASSMIAEIKALVRSLDHEECVSAMTEILALNSAAAVRAEVIRRWPQCVQQ